MANQSIAAATDLSLGAALSASAAPAGASGSATPSWLSSLSTPSIETDMAAADVNGVVTAQGLTKLLTDLDATLSSSTLTAAELTDLQTIAAHLNTGLSTSSYLSYAFNALANGNAANAYWTGGGANAVGLGNLAAGASQTQLGELIGKWFQGTDLPSSYVDMTGSTPFTVGYSTVTNAVFGPSGPSMNDINQGDLGDCYFLAACAEVADMNPSDIESMFSNNGNGTYGVRFYYDGAPEYVTVNLSLAGGGTDFNHATDIWASLAEKAWAQFQAINLDTGNGSYNDGNSWSTIGNGGYIASAMEAVSGASAITGFAPNGSAWDDYTWNSSLGGTGYTSGVTTSSVLATVEAALTNHDDVEISSNTDATDGSGKTTLVSDHVFTVYGYDSANGNLEVRNPWGTVASGQYWDTTFEVSLSTLLAAGDWIEFDNLGGASALPNPATTANYLNNISAYDQFVSGIQISDAAAAVAASFDALNADTHIAKITLTDSGTPTLNLTTTQATSDTTALGKISNQAFEVIAGGAHTYYVQAGPLVTLADSNASFKLSGGAQATVTGGGDVVNFAAGSKDTVSLFSTGGNWDALYGSNGTVNLNSAQTSVFGGGDTVNFAGGSANATTLLNTAGNWDVVNGSNGTVYLSSAQAAVFGGGNTIDFAAGSGNATTLLKTLGNWDVINGSNGTVYLSGAQAAVFGGGDTIDFAAGSGNATTLVNTAGNWDVVNGSNGTVYLSGAQAAVWGGGDTIDFAAGSGNATTLVNTAGIWDVVNGSNGTVYLSSAQAAVWGGGDTIDFAAGSGNAATLVNTAGNWDVVEGSNGTVNLNGAQASLMGGGDTINLSGTSSIGFQAAFGLDTVNGFASTDTLQFSASDFASWSALQGHISQSGANTVITLDANDKVTLTGVTATSLTASEFHFV